MTVPANHPMRKMFFRLLVLGMLGSLVFYSKTIGLIAKGAMKAVRAEGKKGPKPRNND
jgi:hypothetical protein